MAGGICRGRRECGGSWSTADKVRGGARNVQTNGRGAVWGHEEGGRHPVPDLYAPRLAEGTEAKHVFVLDF